MSAALKTTALSWGYSGRPLGSGLDLELMAGESVAIVGPNGVGKSTLIRTLAGMQPPLNGNVNYGQCDAAQLRPEERARYVAVLPQRMEIEHGLSVAEVVALGRTPYLGLWGRMSREDHDAIERALTLCGLRPHAARLLERLSGGEQQRALIAMVVAQQAPILLLDEPTTHLDLHWQHEVDCLLSTLRHETGIATATISHDLAGVFRNHQRVFLLTAGRAVHLDGGPHAHRAEIAVAFDIPESRVP